MNTEMLNAKTLRINATETLESYVSFCLRGLDATQLETFALVTALIPVQVCLGSDRPTVVVPSA